MRIVNAGRVLLLVCAALSVRSAIAAEGPKAARSVHLGYVGAAGCAFYNEVIVDQSTSGSFFMVAGFNHGYFGIQDRTHDKVVIFSVWDPTRGDDAQKVPLEQRVEILHADADVETKRFGGEGTGGQSFYRYAWQPGKRYRFVVRAAVEGEKTAYAGYFFVPEQKRWKHLVTFRTRTGGDELKGLYSFVEDFRRDSRSADAVRRARFGNGWVADASGQWQPIFRAKFTASGSDFEAKHTIDAGVAGGEFYLQTGGATKTTSPLNGLIECQKPALPPNDFPSADAKPNSH